MSQRLAAWLSTHRKTVGLWFLMLGFIFFSFPSAYRTTKEILRSQQPKSTSPTARLGSPSSFDVGPIRIDQKLLVNREPTQPPLRIVVPDLAIDLSVIEANVVGGYWELSETTASHGVGSANPGEVGNTVIFAHARKGMFLPLRDIQIGQSIYVLTKDRWYRYRVSETKLVDPGEVEVIAPTSDETLTLYTCSGFLDSKRLIVTAKPLRP